MPSARRSFCDKFPAQYDSVAFFKSRFTPIRGKPSIDLITSVNSSSDEHDRVPTIEPWRMSDGENKWGRKIEEAIP